MDLLLRTARWVAGPAVFLLILLFAGRSAAHDLAVDQLTLFPDVTSAHLRGQILFDPKLTRVNDDESPAAVASRVVSFLKQNLALEVDGRRLEPKFEIRELWSADGAVAGDSVMLDAELPHGAKEIRIFAGKPLRALAVSVEAVGPNGRSSPESALLLGGDWTPPYRFAAPKDNRGWAEGGLELLADKVPRHEDGVSTAEAAPAPTPKREVRAAGFARESAWSTSARYVRLGIEHILPHGWDHVLFVAGLVLGSRKRVRSLLVQLGAFTLAHTVTLALGALGLVVLPGSVVEPLIAFSIAFVALENVVRKGEPRRRAGWALAFGLLHGQGFASALAETGLPRESFLTALFSFNVGVELGQLVVVAVLLLLLHGLSDPDRFHRYAVRPGSIAIAMAGLYWGVERLTA
jgi:hypothetical protein